MIIPFTLRAGSAALRTALANPATLSRLSAGAASSSSAAALSRFSTVAARRAVRPAAPRLATPLAARNVAPRRSYYQGGEPAVAPPAGTANTGRRLLSAGLIFGGTLIGMNLMFNRETRTDGGMPLFEREYLNDTFMHTGLGIGIIGFAANAMVRNGFVYRIMATNPWVVGIGGLALSFGTMLGTRAIDPDNYVAKYGMWTAFNATQAALVAPMIAFFPPAILARAGLYTVAMMGSLAFVGATAKQDKYLYIGGPLMAGMAVVLASGLAPLILPVTAVRTLALTESLWLYGGLAVMGGFTLYDVQKVLHHARQAEYGVMKRDPVNESIGLELDFINIWIRMVQILAMQNGKRK
jgi:FtsH-binding integral membrane protein